MCVLCVYSPHWCGSIHAHATEAAHGGGNQRLLIRKYEVLTPSGGRLTSSFI